MNCIVRHSSFVFDTVFLIHPMSVVFRQPPDRDMYSHFCPPFRELSRLRLQPNTPDPHRLDLLFTSSGLVGNRRPSFVIVQPAHLIENPVNALNNMDSSFATGPPTPLPNGTSGNTKNLKTLDLEADSPFDRLFFFFLFQIIDGDVL